MKSPRVQVVWKRSNRQRFAEGAVLCLHLVALHINHVCSSLYQLYLFLCKYLNNLFKKTKWDSRVPRFT